MDTACQASLSFTLSLNFLKLMSIELVMPSNHLILCHPLLLLPSIFPSIRVSASGDLQRALQGFWQWQIPKALGCPPLMLSFPWRWKEKPTQKPAPSPPRPQSQHQDILVLGTLPGWPRPFPGSGDTQGEHQSRAPVLQGGGAMRAPPSS